MSFPSGWWVLCRHLSAAFFSICLEIFYIHSPASELQHHFLPDTWTLYVKTRQNKWRIIKRIYSLKISGFLDLWVYSPRETGHKRLRTSYWELVEIHFLFFSLFKKIFNIFLIVTRFARDLPRTAFPTWEVRTLLCPRVAESWCSPEPGLCSQAELGLKALVLQANIGWDSVHHLTSHCTLGPLAVIRAIKPHSETWFTWESILQ